MTAIVNVDKNWGIGRDGDQPFYIPEDLKFFSDKTRGNVVVMGRATLEALPNSSPLPKRINIVMTKQEEMKVRGATVCNDFDQLFKALQAFDDREIFVIGGAKLYNDLLQHCTKAYVTKIFDEATCDRWFPNLDEMPNWRLSHASEVKSHKGLEFQFCEYVKEREGDVNGN